MVNIMLLGGEERKERKEEETMCKVFSCGVVVFCFSFLCGWFGKFSCHSSSREESQRTRM